ncbi:MAG: hypothetical protein ACI837_001858 [Crocinitomicaceae bacterium]|jgi:hypothetical protein
MWLLQFLKETLSKSLDDLAERNRGRFKFYVLFYLMSTLVSFIIVFCCTYVILLFRLPEYVDVIDHMLDIGIMIFDYLYFLVSAMTLLFIIKYRMYLQDYPEKRYSIKEAFGKIDSTAYGYFLIVTIVGTFLLGYYFVDPAEPLNYYDDYTDYWTIGWIGRAIDSLMVLLAQVLPLVTLGYYAILLRKKISITYKVGVWKPILGFVVLAMILLLVHNRAYYLIDELVMNVIRAPFEQAEIPVFLGVMVSGFLNVIYYMVLSTFVHYSFEFAKDASKKG